MCTAPAAFKPTQQSGSDHAYHFTELKSQEFAFLERPAGVCNPGAEYILDLTAIFGTQPRRVRQEGSAHQPDPSP
jgi:hypothetical protein